MKLPRAYGSTLLTILSLPKDARGIFSQRFVGSEIPPKRNSLRFQPRAYARGFSRRGINMPILPLITLTSAFSYFETFPRFLKPFCGNDWLVISGCALDKRIRV